MLSSVVAVVALVVLVLPGFVCSRVAAGRRAQPTSLTDLELILRSLGYTLIVHGIYVGLGWTPCLVDNVRDAGADWGSIRWQLIGFAAAVLATAAVLGYVIGEILRGLEHVGTENADSRCGRLAFAAFHALGGQDARDAFDYAFERRRKRDKSFIVVLRVTPIGDADDGLRVGLFGPESYSGASPRPHDIHLQEVWKFDGPGRLKRAKPLHEAWYKADEIKDIWFREITRDEVEAGVVRDFARGGLAEALKQHRARYASAVVAKAAELSGDVDAAQRSIKEVLERFESVGSDPTYEEFFDLRDDVEAAAAATAAAAGQRERIGLESQELNLRTRIESSRHQKYDWDLWQLMLKYYGELPRDRFKWEAFDIAAHLAIGLMWFDDLDPADWEESDEERDPEEPTH